MIRQIIIVSVVSVLSQGCFTTGFVRESKQSVVSKSQWTTRPVRISFYRSADDLYAKVTSPKAKQIFTGKYTNNGDITNLLEALRHPNLREGFITQSKMCIWINDRGEPFYGSVLVWDKAELSTTASPWGGASELPRCDIEKKPTSNAFKVYTRMVVGIPFTLAVDVITCPAQLCLLYAFRNFRFN